MLNRFKLCEALANSSSTILNSYHHNSSHIHPLLQPPKTTTATLITPITATSPYRRSPSLLKSTTIFDFTTTATLKISQGNNGGSSLIAIRISDVNCKFRVR